jgi:tRNA pseudouridine65 synthase
LKEYSILYLDDRLVVIDKPAGHHVHRPETNPEKVPRDKIVLGNLRDQIGKKLFPIHRLDAGTSGVLAFALDSEAAKMCAEQFQNKRVKKIYWALVRGYLQPDGLVSIPLEKASSALPLEAVTSYRTLKTLELNEAVGKKFSTARYSWLEVSPLTGRFHQIRRHMNRISHPVIGDATHGDSHHNTFFREKLGIGGLCLRAISLELNLPWQGEIGLFRAPISSKWKKIEELFAIGSPKT